MKKKKQTKRKHGNGKQIALVVIVIFLIAAITAALLWLSDCGKNWDVRTWGDKFKSEQVTKPDDSGNKKPIIPVIPEPTLFDAIEVGDEIKAMYIDTDYVITDEDIAAFKSQGKAVEEDGNISYYLIYEQYRAYSPFGLRYIEIDSATLKALLDGTEYNSDDISNDAAVHAFSFVYEGGGGIIWTNISGYISDELLNWIFGGDDIQIGWGASEYICSPAPIHVQEVYCADVLQKFIDIKSEAEYYEQNQ